MTDKIVPGLVRYEPHDIEYANEAYLVEHPDGEYVRYSEAAAMLAETDMELEVAKFDAQTSEERANTASSAMHSLAKRLEELASELHDKRAELATLKEINANLMGDDEDKPRYTTNRLKLEIEKARTKVLEEALQAIASLPTGETEDIMGGHEDAYRAVEKLLRS